MLELWLGNLLGGAHAGFGQAIFHAHGHHILSAHRHKYITINLQVTRLQQWKQLIFEFSDRCD